MVSRTLRALWKPLLLYTGLLGLLTVGAVYLATHSGLYMVVLAGGGLALVALGGGIASRRGVSQAEFAGETAGGREAVASVPGPTSALRTDTPPRINLLFYGLGLFLWSVLVLRTLRDTLV